MKKLLLSLSVCAVALAGLTGCSSEEYEVALVTDKGTINDGSFNEGAWDGIKEYCEKNEVSHQYYQPADATDTDRWNSIQLAAKGGAKVIVLPGYLFESTIVDASETYPEIKFLLLDGSFRNDVDRTDEDGKVIPTFGLKYTKEKEDAGTYDNVYCVNYQEEQAGYLAGYAAVMDGNKHLGFMGGVEMPAVTRFGYGYIQGANAAAAAEEINITMKYNYIGDFTANDSSKSLMEGWFGASTPTDVVFSCGGGIWTSVKDAIAKYNYKGKMIGVDVDQVADGAYGDKQNFVLTSATKGLKNTVVFTLGEFFNDKWADLGGEIETLGLGASADATQYVGLPTETDSWNFETFTVAQYNALVTSIQTGTVTVNSTFDSMATLMADTNTSTSEAALIATFGLNNTTITVVAA